MSAALPSSPDESVELCLFGPPVLLDRPAVPFGAERRFQLLVLLAIRAGEWVPREQVAALLWPEMAAADARRNLRHALFKARAVPGAAALAATDHALCWSVGTDLAQFRRALREARPADAVALRRGPLAQSIEDSAGSAFAQWLQAERARVDAQWREAALEHLRGLADPAAQLALVEALLAADPLDERALNAALVAEVGLGRRLDAQRRYRDYARRLADELGVEPSHAVRALVERAGEPVAAQRDDAAAAAPPAVPVAQDARSGADDDYVGRRLELRELGLLLAEPAHRLITVLGPGGIGKSRLARHAVHGPGDRFPGGVHWIELQDLEDLPAVVARVAAALGASVRDTDDPLPALARRVGGSRCLLVLDNAEHLVALPAWVDALLAAAPALTVLATTRVRLGLAVERLVPLGGLAVPDEDSRDLDAAAAFDAVRLFAQRAQRAQRTFALAEHLPAVLRIVEAVEGLPLAIELAAAWTRLLPPEEIARDLDRALDWLERDPAAGGAPMRPEHASVRAALDRSWQLLAPRERAALAALALFRGGFTRAAALAVAGVPLPVLSSLADRSMLTVDPGGRFSLHPLVAAYAEERGGADPATAASLRTRHAEHYAGLLADLAPALRSEPRLLIEGIEAEFANAVAAWRMAVALRRFDLVEAMARPLGAYFEQRGRYREGDALLRPALELGSSDLPAQRAQARVRGMLATLLHRRGELDAGLAMAQAGLALAEAVGDERTRMHCLSEAGGCLSVGGRWREARVHFERALDSARSLGDRASIAPYLSSLGICAKKDGDFDAALAFYGEALEIERELGRVPAMATVLLNTANVHMARRDWAGARARYAECRLLCDSADLTGLVPYVEEGMAGASFELGDLDGARRHAERALAAAKRIGLLPVVNYSGALLARIERAHGRPEAAREQLRALAHAARAPYNPAHLIRVALYFGQLRADAAAAADAYRIWRMVESHPSAEASTRALCVQWCAALPLAADERKRLEARPATLDQVIDELLG